MKPAIRVDQLSKQYQIGARKIGGYRTLRETITDALTAPFRGLRSWARRPAASESNGQATPANGARIAGTTMWALRDVSFDIQPGEVVGIIGRNGAGKSTLLKVLSRITEPTAGRIELRGRVGSLLEVGTGFHPELSGRENIFLNGAILGMTRREIQRKFDEIIAFAEIEDFLETPVKRYSSGMYVRLAFAVAAHLEPEILIVDEVLAVGDASFQKKCLGKMGDVARAGRTILFVSHNMAAVEGLCQRGVVLHQGQIGFIGDAREAVRHYHQSVQTMAGETGHRFDLVRQRIQHADPDFQVQELTITSAGELAEAGYIIGAPLEFRVRGVARKPISRLLFGISLSRSGRGLIVNLDSQRSGGQLPTVIEGPFSLTCAIKDLYLTPGDYTIALGAKAGGALIYSQEDVGSLTILPCDFFGTGYNPDPGLACVLCRQEWQLTPTP